MKLVVTGEESMFSIRLISCYFGKLKPEVELWLQSCYNNPTIDFLFVTDQDLEVLKANVQVLKISFEQMKSNIEAELGMEVCLPTPYKLCDYKVAYGLIFKEYLNEYDFWGYCDSDMIFGDIRHFVTDELLANNEKILSLGHLSIYRNVPRVCKRFMEGNNIMDYRKVFSDAAIYQFDETPGIYEMYVQNGWKFCDYLPFLDIVWDYNKRLIRYCYAKRLYGIQVHNHAWQLYYVENGKVWEAYSDDGKIIHTREYLYIHSSKRAYQCSGDVPQQYYLLPGKIKEKTSGKITWMQMKEECRQFNCSVEKIELWISNFIYRVKKKMR